MISWNLMFNVRSIVSIDISEKKTAWTDDQSYFPVSFSQCHLACRNEKVTKACVSEILFLSFSSRMIVCWWQKACLSLDELMFSFCHSWIHEWEKIHVHSIPNRISWFAFRSHEKKQQQKRYKKVSALREDQRKNDWKCCVCICFDVAFVREWCCVHFLSRGKVMMTYV